MSETITFSLRFVAIGISIVFLSLALIATVVYLIRRADDRWMSYKNRQSKPTSHEAQSIDNITLVLISAAVSTMLLGRYHIRSIRRLLPNGFGRSPWSMEGRAILHGSHIIQKRHNVNVVNGRIQ